MSKPTIKPNISENFTVEDIHKIREHNREATNNMTFDERRAYYEQGANEVLKRIALLKANKKITA